MALANFDELNVLSTGLFEVPEKSRRAKPYDEYFGDMYLTQEQIDRRIALAEELEDIVGFYLLMMLTETQYGFSYDSSRLAFIEQLEEADIGDDDYRENLADELTDSTEDNLDDTVGALWFFSQDRAMFVAENEANTLENQQDFEDALARGFTRKQWVGIPDHRERRTHRELNDTIIPIEEYFDIGLAKGLFPKDVSSVLSTLPDHPEELINCRCSVSYLP